MTDDHVTPGKHASKARPMPDPIERIGTRSRGPTWKERYLGLVQAVTNLCLAASPMERGRVTDVWFTEADWATFSANLPHFITDPVAKVKEAERKRPPQPGCEPPLIDYLGRVAESILHVEKQDIEAVADSLGPEGRYDFSELLVDTANHLFELSNEVERQDVEEEAWQEWLEDNRDE